MNHKKKHSFFDVPEDSNYLEPIKKTTNKDDEQTIEPKVEPVVPSVQGLKPIQKPPIGGYDPYYRTPQPTRTRPQPTIEPLQPSVPHPKVTPDKPTERPPIGGYDPYYRTPLNKTNIKPSDALDGPDITDAEGLRRAYETDSNVYVYKGVEYVAGTKGGIFSSDMIENVKYIGIPNVKSAIASNLQTLQNTILSGFTLPEEALMATIGLGLKGAIKNQLMPNDDKDTMKPDIESLTRFKNAEQAYLANKGYIQRVVGDSSGGAVIEQLKQKYPQIEGGRGYGAPLVDVFGRSSAKTFLEGEQAKRDADKDWRNVPENLVNSGFEYLIGKGLGLDSVKTPKETGIQQYRTAGDLVAGFNNSATTTIAPISDIIKYKTLTHSYNLTASHYSTSSETTAQANGFINDDKSMSLLQ